jgi:F-type H+-transporting ATPase subunit delta
MAGAAAKRYAKAVFELAQQDGDLGRWRRRLESVVELLAVAELEGVLRNRGIATETRVELLREAAGKRLDPEGLNLAVLLLENRRVEQAAEVLEEFDALADEAEGRVRARAVTAVELGEDERKRLEQQLSGQFGGRVRLDTEVDPEILGGLVLRIGDRLVDASVRTRLQQLRRRLATSAS